MDNFLSISSILCEYKKTHISLINEYKNKIKEILPEDNIKKSVQNLIFKNTFERFEQLYELYNTHKENNILKDILLNDLIKHYKIICSIQDTLFESLKINRPFEEVCLDTIIHVLQDVYKHLDYNLDNTYTNFNLINTLIKFKSIHKQVEEIFLPHDSSSTFYNIKKMSKEDIDHFNKEVKIEIEKNNALFESEIEQKKLYKHQITNMQQLLE